MRGIIRTGALAVLLMAGCKPAAGPTVTSAAPAAAPAPAEVAHPKVALIMKSLANDFFATMAEGARRHHQEHAMDYELRVAGIKNETDLNEQVNLVEQAVAQGAAAIVIAPADSKALVPALKRAAEHGVVIVNIDNRLDPDVMRAAGLAASFVGPDNRDGARRVGEALAARLKSGDETAIIEGVTTAFNGRERRAGFEAAMQSAGMRVVAVQSGDWEMERANTVAANLLAAHPALKALLCANDNMAIGAAAAVAAAGKTRSVYVVGFDDIAAIKPLLADGRILATADQHADRLAADGIEHALAAIHHARQAVDATTPVDLVTR